MNKKYAGSILKKKIHIYCIITCIFVFTFTSCSVITGGWSYFTPQKLFEKRFNIELPGNAKIIQYEWDDDENAAVGVIEVTEDYARELIATMKPNFHEIIVGDSYYEMISNSMFGAYYSLSYRENDIEYMARITCECRDNYLTVVNQHNGTMLIYIY